MSPSEQNIRLYVNLEEKYLSFSEFCLSNEPKNEKERKQKKKSVENAV